MLTKFPQSNNPKLEYRSIFRPEIIAKATLLGLKGFILTQPEYETSEGQVPGDVFVPKVEPPIPGAHSTALQLSRNTILRNMYKEEHSKYVQFTSEFIGAFDKTHLAIIGDRTHGTLNRSLLQMKTALDMKYDVFTPKEITALIKTLGDGTVTINPDDPIEIYLQKIEIIFNAAATSQSTISEVDKIEYVIAELKKLNIAEIMLWIMSYETTHPTIVSKDYPAFALSLQVMYQNINRDTMRSAGYTAQATEQIQDLMAQVKALNKTVQELEKRPRNKDSNHRNPLDTHTRGANSGKRERERGNNKQQKKGKGVQGTRFCDTCEFNHTHWSNMCKWPKDGHNEDRMAP